MSYTPDCADCPTPAECKAENDCRVLRQIRHPERGPNVLAMQVAALKAIYGSYRSNDASSMEVCGTLRAIDLEALLKVVQATRPEER